MAQLPLSSAVAKPAAFKSLFPATPTAFRALPDAPSRFLAACAGPPPAAESRAGSFLRRLASSTPLSTGLSLSAPPITPSICFLLFLRTSHSSPTADCCSASPLCRSSGSGGIGSAELSHVSRPVRYYARLQNKDGAERTGSWRRSARRFWGCPAVFPILAGTTKVRHLQLSPARTSPRYPSRRSSGARRGGTTSQGEGGAAEGTQAPRGTHGAVAARRSPLTAKLLYLHMYLLISTRLLLPPAARGHLHNPIVPDQVETGPGCVPGRPHPSPTPHVGPKSETDPTELLVH